MISWTSPNTEKPSWSWLYLETWTYLLVYSWIEYHFVAWDILVSNKANLRILIAATCLVILLKFDSNRPLITRVTLNFFMNDLEKQGTSSILHQALCIISNPFVKSNLSYSPEMLNSGKNLRFFVRHDLEIWWMTLNNIKTPHLYYNKLCATFQTHWYIETGVTVRKPSIRVKIGNFL